VVGGKKREDGDEDEDADADELETALEARNGTLLYGTAEVLPRGFSPTGALRPPAPVSPDVTRPTGRHSSHPGVRGPRAAV
jgi:hypothetical protein